VEIAAARDRLLASVGFQRSPRLSRLAVALFDVALSGRKDAPKEYELGVGVFDRDPNYSPQADPIVRVQVRQLRFKLHEYYETEGADDPIRIDLPKGGYGLQFRWPRPEPEPATPIEKPRAEVSQPAAGPRSGWHRFWFVWPAGALLLGLGVLVFFRTGTKAGLSHNPTGTAQDLYLKGRYYWNKRTADDLNRAQDFFTRAITNDPGYAAAYVGLADTYSLQREYGAMPDSTAWPRALEAARRAVALDNTLPEAHRALAFCLFYGDLDFAGGDREFRRALALDPRSAVTHHWYGTALMSMLRFDDAAVQLEEARKLDPSSRAILADTGLLLYNRGQADKAIALLREVSSAEPSFSSPHAYLAGIALDQGRSEDFLREQARAAELSGSLTERAMAAAALNGYSHGGTAAMLTALTAERERQFHENHGSAYAVARAAAREGRTRMASYYLRISSKRRETDLVSLAMDSSFRTLRGDREFQNLLSRMGLPMPR
jgi:tetratricopeptide (TPR) repeat protein